MIINHEMNLKICLQSQKASSAAYSLHYGDVNQTRFVLSFVVSCERNALRLTTASRHEEKRRPRNIGHESFRATVNHNRQVHTKKFIYLPMEHHLGTQSTWKRHEERRSKPEKRLIVIYNRQYGLLCVQLLCKYVMHFLAPTDNFHVKHRLCTSCSSSSLVCSFNLDDFD